LILSRVHPDERTAVQAGYDEARRAHGTFESEHRLVFSYGRTRWVIMRGRCLQDERGAFWKSSRDDRHERAEAG
jgi:hypothetical protein